MKLLRTIFLLFLLLILPLLGCIFYAFQIEPYRIKINQISFTQDSASGAPLKIVQISDLHIKKDFTSRNLTAVVKKINAQDPDFVVFTGDLYDNYSIYKEDEQIISELQQIKSRYGKIAIWGNRDYGGGAVRQYQTIMERSGFLVLKNEHLFLTMENDRRILFTGIDDAMLGDPDSIGPVGNSHADYKVLLTHEPDIAKRYWDYDYDMILSGHSHGGQINIPFFPAINKKAVAVTSFSTTYSSGLYLPDGTDSPVLYVNTGIGTTHISARFGVIPEIAVFDIAI